MFWLKSLYDEYMIMQPKQMASEKKTCITASNQTFGSRIFDHCGVRKYMMPSKAPGSVQALINRMNKLTYGNKART
jgi:hypothetical protein